MRYRRAAGGLLALVLADGACFDSDETFKSGPATTTGTSGSVTTTATETTTGPETTTIAETGPYDTCRDAIDCVFQCAATIQAQMQMPGFEPDLGCFIECAETLSVDEVYLLFNLINCTGQVCKELGECVDNTGTGSSSDSSSGSSSDSTSSSGSESTSGSTGSGSSTSGSSTSGSSSESSSSSSSSEAGEPDPDGILDPCINCIFTRMLDPESPGCEEFAMMCQ